MTAASLFDVIAPIAIYHGADVCYKKQAQASIKKLAGLQRTCSYTKSIIGHVLPADFRWEDLLEFGNLPNGEDVRDIYDKLLIEMVEEVAPEWSPTHDASGCRCFQVEGRRIDALCGDSSNHFAWYETSDLVLQRINEELSHA